jgi:D-xylose 1-dehydrogenase (NADP+, D-xylono-1,5-lactone-forming)
MSVRFGILSTARINRLVLPGARASDRVEIAAVASRDRARAEAYAREHGIPRAYGSYEELLADPDLDAIYNPLPNSLHVEWSIRALEAGKHVLCEKPLSRRPEEVERAFDAAERAGLLLMEAFMYRHNPQTAKLLELVRGGAVGKPRVVRAAFSFTVTNAANIRLAADLDGGALMDVGCYCVSGMRLLAGEPERVSGRRIDGGDGVDVRFTGMLAFPGGVFGSFDCGLDMVARSALEVVGDSGSLLLEDPWHSRAPGIELRRPEGAERIEVAKADPYACELEDFAAAARGQRPHPFGRADAVGQARTIAALYRAAESGRDEVP